MFDRSTEDLGNIVELGHVNVRVPDQLLATLFYIAGLGLTRDPYLMTGVDNMWANVGRSQFHLPTGPAQVLRGVTGLVLPDRAGLLARLRRVAADLAGTAFAFAEGANHVDAVCPWGNRIRIHPPGAAFGRVALGMAYVAFDVPEGAPEAIVRFYADILAAPARLVGGVAVISAGPDQRLIFHPGTASAPVHGDHIQITLADFSGPHRRLSDHGLITEESNASQYRFDTIIDPATGAAAFRIEHEVRSMRHPLYGRALVNRNPGQTNATYAPGHDTIPWAMA